MGPDNAEARTLVVGLFTMVMKGTSAAGSCGSKSCEANKRYGAHGVTWRPLGKDETGDAGEPVWRSPARTRKSLHPLRIPLGEPKRAQHPNKTNKASWPLTRHGGHDTSSPASHHLVSASGNPSVHRTDKTVSPVTNLYLFSFSPWGHRISRLKSTFFFGLCQLLILTTRSSHLLTCRLTPQFSYKSSWCPFTAIGLEFWNWLSIFQSSAVMIW